jgi:hypothetical protein
MAHTVKEVQEKLRAKGLYSDEIDGLAGPNTARAVAAFQTAEGLEPNGVLDPKTLSRLFPAAITAGPRTIKATMTDYLLNLVKSKTVWAATALVAALVAWVQTKFGIEVSPEIKDAVTTILSLGLGGAVALLQSAFNSPHMTTKQPGVVQKPAEFR